MTENKRFRFQCDDYHAWSVWDNKNVVVYDLNTKYDAEVVCKALNDLYDENEQLKKQLQSILKLTKKIEDYTHDIKMMGDVE